MNTIKRVTRWFRNSKKPQHTAKSSEISSSSRSGLYDLDSSSPRTRRSCPTRHAKRPQKCSIDKEYNAVLVPAYGDCMSVSDSDGSDWSIGWTEPHGLGFEQGRNQKDSSFAVLVPCYKTGNIQQKGNSKQLSSAANNARAVSEDESYIEQWLASLPDPDDHDNHIQHQNMTSLS